MFRVIDSILFLTKSCDMILVEKKFLKLCFYFTICFKTNSSPSWFGESHYLYHDKVGFRRNIVPISGYSRGDKNAALANDNDKSKKLVYFISRALQNVELQYPKVEKIILTLVFLAWRLHSYFQAHLLIVRTDKRIK